jgi:hypothetical protein
MSGLSNPNPNRSNVMPSRQGGSVSHRNENGQGTWPRRVQSSWSRKLRKEWFILVVGWVGTGVRDGLVSLQGFAWGVACVVARQLHMLCNLARLV